MEYLSCGHHMCAVVSQISHQSQLCWNIWLHIKLEHSHSHLMASIKSYLILSKFVTSLLIAPTVPRPACRRPFMPTDSFYCAGRVRGCRQSPDCAGRPRIAQTSWLSSSIIRNRSHRLSQLPASLKWTFMISVNSLPEWSVNDLGCL